ncbi:hypothetical protein Taro_033361 [Colocasia esculenta]|uniref:Uncharacterized protein n=1 Tax=Colocasia esculenta TaxID=4460 RepID=A0A843VXP2_COLES|nr:hypothetical protein [Colocasia esculenta]
MLLSLPGTPSPARLLERVLRVVGVLKSRTWSRRGKRWGHRRRVVCRALLAGLVLRGETSQQLPPRRTEETGPQ